MQEQPQLHLNIPQRSGGRLSSGPGLSLAIPPQNVCFLLRHFYHSVILTSQHTPVATPISQAPPKSTPPQPSMSAPPPLLRPPIPGSRGNGPRTPRLGLAIPPLPNSRLAPTQNPTEFNSLSLNMNNLSLKTSDTTAPPQVGGRPALPKLQLAMGSTSSASYSSQPISNGRPNLSLGIPPQNSASGGSESSTVHSRSGSFGPMDGRASNPTSAGSQFSALSFASQYGILNQHSGTPDPASAVGSIYSQTSEGGVGMERENSMGGPNGLSDVDSKTLELARTADIEELNDDAWRIAALEKRIVELGSLGEGAGGAVTRCMLKGGKTIFALKVCVINCA